MRRKVRKSHAMTSSSSSSSSSGIANMDVLDNWGFKVMNYMEVMEVSDKLMIKLLGSSLTRKANTFYMQYIALKQDKWTVDMLITTLFDYCFPNNTIELLRKKWDKQFKARKECWNTPENMRILHKSSKK